MNDLIIGKVERRIRTDPKYSELKFNFSLPPHFSLICNHDLNTDSWSSGNLSADKVRDIVNKSAEGQRFIENGAWSIAHFDESREKSILFHPRFYWNSSNVLSPSVQNMFVFSNDLEKLF